MRGATAGKKLDNVVCGERDFQIHTGGVRPLKPRKRDYDHLMSRNWCKRMLSMSMKGMERGAPSRWCWRGGGVGVAVGGMRYGNIQLRGIWEHDDRRVVLGGIVQ